MGMHWTEQHSFDMMAMVTVTQMMMNAAAVVI